MAFLVIHFLTNHMKLQVDSWKNRFESIRFEQFSSLILRPLLVLGPSYFPEKSYDFVLLFDFSFSCFRPTIIVSENKNMIFQHFGRLFLPGTLKNVPCCLNELLVIFREESINSGMVPFCSLEVPSDGQLAQLRFFLSKPIDLNEIGRLLTGRLFRIFPVSIFLSKLGQLAIR